MTETDNNNNNNNNEQHNNNDDDNNPSSTSPSFQVEKSTIQTKRGINCTLHKWTPSSSSSSTSPTKQQLIRGKAIIYHGYSAHGRYPTVQYVAQLLASNSFIVYAMDMQGHGESDGTRGLLPSRVEDMVEDCVSVVTHVKKEEEEEELPLFLIGSSMGGALAIKVSQSLPSSSSITGMVLLAPMLSLNVNSIEQTALKSLAWLVPTLPLIPSSATSSKKQYRDAQRRAEVDADTLTYKGKLRCQSACTLVELALSMKDCLEEIKVPFLCMIGTEDVVVDNSVAEGLLMEKARRVDDKVLKKYDALHGLMCEPKPLRDEIEGDLVRWILERCGGGGGGSDSTD